jgi:hypothetical protein
MAVVFEDGVGHTSGLVVPGDRCALREMSLYTYIYVYICILYVHSNSCLCVSPQSRVYGGDGCGSGLLHSWLSHLRFSDRCRQSVARTGGYGGGKDGGGAHVDPRVLSRSLARSLAHPLPFYLSV